MKLFSMKTKLWFYLLVVCGAAESFKETSVDLGQNVTLSCEIFVSDVYWFLMKPAEPPVCVLRSYSARIRPPEYSNQTFQKTFSLGHNSSLFIHKISSNELGVYHCVRPVTGSAPHIGTGIRLYVPNPSAEVKPGFDTNLVVSLAGNCVMAVVVAVLIICHHRRAGKAPALAPGPGLQQSEDNSNLVYADVRFHTLSRPVQMSDLNSTYASVIP